jgi:S1-C subfamily serine protease
MSKNSDSAADFLFYLLLLIVVGVGAFTVYQVATGDPGCLPVDIQVHQLQQSDVAPPPQCVKVHSDDTGSTGSLGTGAYIGPRLVVTANHVVQDRASDTSITVSFPNADGTWTEIGGEVLAGIKKMDFAIIQLESDPPCQPLAIDTDRPVPGDKLSFMGYGGGEFKQVQGVVNKKKFSYGWLEIDGPPSAISGDSGGPILNARGQYVGTLWGGNGVSTIFTSAETIVAKILDLDFYLPEPAEPEENNAPNLYEPLNPATIAGRYHNRKRTNNFYRRAS